MRCIFFLCCLFAGLSIVASNIKDPTLGQTSTTPDSNISMCMHLDGTRHHVDGIGGYLANLLSTSSYPARWNCGYWSDFEGWFMIISDLSIFLAYLSIPFLLVFIVLKKQKVIPFKRFFYLFASFILLCGTTHLIDAVIFWEPLYRLSGLMKFFTAIVSWGTVIAISQALPVALTYKSPKELQKEVDLRKQAQDQLNAFVKYTPGAVAMFDREMRYLEVSDRWYHDFNLQGQEIIGRSYYEVSPEVGDKWRAIHQRCLNGGVDTDEGMVTKQDGSIQWLSWDIRPWLDSNGQIGGLIMRTEDITQKRLASEQIRISEEKFKNAFDHAAIGMALVGLRGEWIKVNSSLSRMIGYTQDELLDRTFQDITYPEDLEADLGLLRELVGGARDSYQLEKRYFHRDGHIVWVLLSVSMVRGEDNQPMFFISQITNISARKEAEQRLEQYMNSLEVKNKELEQFTYIASHDLREPLNTISSFVDIIQHSSEERTEEFNEYLHFIADSVERMRDLIQELLNFSRLNNRTEFAEVDLNEVLQDVKSDLNHVLQADKVELTIQDLPVVRGNSSHLRILYQNLIGNAIKFKKPAENPKIEIGTEVREGVTFCFVKDNGIGIDPKYAEKIFLIFQKLHHHDEYPGTGIGLANCKKIVNMHGGDIFVESEEGTGSTFYFNLKTIIT